MECLTLHEVLDDTDTDGVETECLTRNALIVPMVLLAACLTAFTAQDRTCMRRGATATRHNIN